MSSKLIMAADGPFWTISEFQEVHITKSESIKGLVYAYQVSQFETHQHKTTGNIA